MPSFELRTAPFAPPPISMIGSFTYRLVTFVYSVVPLTVKLPEITMLPEIAPSVAFNVPTLAVVVTTKLESVPTEVMFGCAFV